MSEQSNEFAIDDLTSDDVSRIGWSGPPTHLRSVRAALERVATGEVEYLCIRDASGNPVAKGGIDYAAHPGAGTLWQLATREDLRSRGLGTLLIAAAEDRVRDRGMRRAVMGVEENNPRARSLYERLGYVEYGGEAAEWDQEDEHGAITRYRTEVALLGKDL